VTLGLPLGPHPCNPFALVASPKLGLRHQCNGMVERMIKTLNSGLYVVSSIDLDNWDLQLPWFLFGYRCGVQASTKFSPFMVFTR